jgi:hypothetical protein
MNDERLALVNDLIVPGQELLLVARVVNRVRVVRVGSPAKVPGHLGSGAALGVTVQLESVALLDRTRVDCRLFLDYFRRHCRTQKFKIQLFLLDTIIFFC